jgi:hypothetical protein
MGRAFRVVKRTTHLTVAVSEKPLKVAPVAPAPGRAKGKAPQKAAAPRARTAKADKE